MQWGLGKGHIRKGFVSYAKELGFHSRGLEMRKGEELVSFHQSNYLIIFAFLGGQLSALTFNVICLTLVCLF